MKIIPGHGKVATKAVLQDYLAMLKETSAIVEMGIQQGKTVEQLQKDKVLAKYDPQWGGGFLKADTFIAQLYNGLKGIAKNP